MRTLTSEELNYVSGGKADQTWAEWFESLANWISNALSGGGNTGAPPPTITGAEIGQLQRDCLDRGGDFSFETTSDSASATFQMVSADGSSSYISVTCTQ